MRKIDHLPFGVPGCALVPHKHSDDWFIDPGVTVPGVDPIPFVSATAVRELAKLSGEFVPISLLDESVANANRLMDRVVELETEVAELERFAQAIDTIESRDFRARKRPGRKPREEVVA